ncbi:hypothetical protein [Haloarchaeobius iranensis]|uniref:hypothetical protein n=1 Tax=Haloarchaeobius iranensis TaxID=996166 RepID=UPI0011142D19|nr:hypothetical protein [Haloarchaeobius iranensis]
MQQEDLSIEDAPNGIIKAVLREMDGTRDRDDQPIISFGGHHVEVSWNCPEGRDCKDYDPRNEDLDRVERAGSDEKMCYIEADKDEVRKEAEERNRIEFERDE